MVGRCIPYWNGHFLGDICSFSGVLRFPLAQAERCDVELGRAWKAAGVKMADLLIATVRQRGGGMVMWNPPGLMKGWRDVATKKAGLLQHVVAQTSCWARFLLWTLWAVGKYAKVNRGPCVSVLQSRSTTVEIWTWCPCLQFFVWNPTIRCKLFQLDLNLKIAKNLVLETLKLFIPKKKDWTTKVAKYLGPKVVNTPNLSWTSKVFFHKPWWFIRKVSPPNFPTHAFDAKDPCFFLGGLLGLLGRQQCQHCGFDNSMVAVENYGCNVPARLRLPKKTR